MFISPRQRARRILAPLAATCLLGVGVGAVLVVVSPAPSAAQVDDDADNDGLSDEAEQSIHGTDPLVGDTDGDGLADGLEVTLGTDPNHADSDRDLESDSQELLHGDDPLHRDEQPLQGPVAELQTAPPAQTEIDPQSISSTSVLLPGPAPASANARALLADLPPGAQAFRETQPGSAAWYLVPVAMFVGCALLLRNRSRRPARSGGSP